MVIDHIEGYFVIVFIIFQTETLVQGQYLYYSFVFLILSSRKWLNALTIKSDFSRAIPLSKWLSQGIKFGESDSKVLLLCFATWYFCCFQGSFREIWHRPQLTNTFMKFMITDIGDWLTQHSSLFLSSASTTGAEIGKTSLSQSSLPIEVALWHHEV